MKRSLYRVVKKKKKNNDTHYIQVNDLNDWNGDLNLHSTITLNTGDSIYVDRSLIPKLEQKHVDLGQEFQSLLNGIPEEIWRLIFTICGERSVHRIFAISCVSSYCHRVCTSVIRVLYDTIKLTSNRILYRFDNQRDLYLKDNNCIHSALIVQTNLTRLCLQRNTMINDELLGQCTTLESLNLSGNSMIHDDSLCKLTNLKKLSLYDNDTITDDSVSCLVKLESLNLEKCGTVYDKGICRLTNLTNLNLNNNQNIKNKALINLTNIKRLHLMENVSILSVTHLKKLKQLYISPTSRVKTDNLQCEIEKRL